jgi:hypothetical protein
MGGCPLLVLIRVGVDAWRLAACTQVLHPTSIVLSWHYYCTRAEMSRESALGMLFYMHLEKHAFNVMMKDLFLALAVVCVHLDPRIFY